jgi:hypothetical protein
LAISQFTVCVTSPLCCRRATTIRDVHNALVFRKITFLSGQQRESHITDLSNLFWCGGSGCSLCFPRRPSPTCLLCDPFGPLRIVDRLLHVELERSRPTGARLVLLQLNTHSNQVILRIGHGARFLLGLAGSWRNWGAHTTLQLQFAGCCFDIRHWLYNGRTREGIN